MSIEYNPEYIHHQEKKSTSTFREMVFGMEDGMVSTLGAITGIAAATQNHSMIILAGMVIISVESISMAVGSYLSSKSARNIEERKIREEKTELQKFPEDEKKELIDMYVIDGWPQELAKTMAETASKNKKLFLQEMAYRELGIVPEKLENPLKNGLVMWLSYILGGGIPIFAYFFLPVMTAIFASIGLTLFSLFILGVYTTKYSKRSWWRAGLEMFVLAGLAALVGYFVGQLVEKFFV
jgi:predicted membrane protein (TIGR00267 family)